MQIIVISNNKNFQLNPNILDDVTVFPLEESTIAINKYNPKLIIVDQEFIPLFFKKPERHAQCISSNTHKGIKLLPITNVYYFQASDKYVLSHHSKGELLITESLSSLEKKYSELFIRIHRKTLVAKEQIQTLKCNKEGKWQISLKNSQQILDVSRRQLANIRKYLQKEIL